MPRKYKELLKFNKETNDPIQKLERHLNQEMDKKSEKHLTKEITEMANKYIKKKSISVVIKEIPTII